MRIVVPRAVHRGTAADSDRAARAIVSVANTPRGM